MVGSPLDCALAGGGSGARSACWECWDRACTSAISSSWWREMESSFPELALTFLEMSSYRRVAVRSDVNSLMLLIPKMNKARHMASRDKFEPSIRLPARKSTTIQNTENALKITDTTMVGQNINLLNQEVN